MKNNRKSTCYEMKNVGNYSLFCTYISYVSTRQQRQYESLILVST